MSVNKSRLLKNILYIIILFFIISYVLSFFGIGFRNDEGFTMALVHHNFFNMIKIDSYDVHPPLYYIVLKLFLIITTFWTKSLLIKVLFARLLSFISFIISIVILIKINDIHHHISKNNLSLIIFTLFPCVLFFATEIRMYSFGALFIILAYYIILKMIHNGFSKIKIFLLFICVLIAAYTHYYYALYVGILIIIYSFMLFKKKYYKKSLIIISLDILLCLTYLPWILFTVKNVVSMPHVATFTLKKFIVQMCKVVLSPTGVIDSSLNSLGLISKIFSIGLIYILLFSGFFVVMHYLNIDIKRVYLINFIIAILLVFIGSLSAFFGYEFSVRFLYPSFLIMLFIDILSLNKYMNNKYYHIIMAFIVIITVIMSVGFNIQNYESSITEIHQYNKYTVYRGKDVYISNNSHSSNINKLQEQPLLTHKIFTNKATLLMYLNKNLVSHHQIKNNKVGNKLWTNIKSNVK